MQMVSLLVNPFIVQLLLTSQQWVKIKYLPSASLYRRLIFLNAIALFTEYITFLLCYAPVLLSHGPSDEYICNKLYMLIIAS